MTNEQKRGKGESVLDSAEVKNGLKILEENASKLSNGSTRVSIRPNTTREEVEQLIAKKVLHEAGKFAPPRASKSDGNSR